MPPPKPNAPLIPESFVTPEGERYSIFRAVSFDNWLIWRDALPDNPTLWSRLEMEQFRRIQELGRRIHLLHQNLPDYRRLSDTPFVVSRWWDPVDPEDNWDCGGKCLLRIEDHTVKEMPLFLCERLELGCTPVSTHWVEFSINSDWEGPAPQPNSSGRQAARYRPA
jgi:hypothetical protein